MSVRFAPSPTGDFHIGNLRTAWISFQIAKHLHLPWALRFEDIDQPRVVSGAQQRQLRDLHSLGLTTQAISIQSQAHNRHFRFFIDAARAGVIYPCVCSRKRVQDGLREMTSAPHGPLPIYTGRCRKEKLEVPSDLQNVGWRFRTDDPNGTEDFLIARTVGSSLDPNDIKSDQFTPAYHWACAIDDMTEGHTVLVRAWDLAPSLKPQRWIQSWLIKHTQSSARLPAAYHTALVTQNNGQRLEKRTQGVTLAQLESTGHLPSELLKCFDKSWDRKDLDPIDFGQTWGEPTHELTLTQLGLI